MTDSINSKEKAILEYASQTKTLFSTQELLSNIPEISRATMVRVLNGLVDKNFLIKSGQGRGVKYKITPNYLAIREVDIDQYFETGYSAREVHTSYNFKALDMLKHDVFSVKEVQQMNEYKKQYHENREKYGDVGIKKELERIMIDFSWKSAAIEGNTYSLIGTEMLLKHAQEESGKSKFEAQMLLNHKDVFYDTLNNIETFKSIRLGDIEYVHSVLTKGLGVHKNIRNHEVGITGTKYKPLSAPMQIKEQLEQTCKIINQKENEYEKSIVAHAMLAYLQAFSDGNKRTARMTSNALLMTHDSLPLSYVSVDEVTYKKAMILFYEQNNLTLLKKIYIEQFQFANRTYFR